MAKGYFNLYFNVHARQDRGQSCGYFIFKDIWQPIDFIELLDLKSYIGATKIAIDNRTHFKTIDVDRFCAANKRSYGEIIAEAQLLFNGYKGLFSSLEIYGKHDESLLNDMKK